MAVSRDAEVKGICGRIFPICRKSCVWWCKWIREPAQIKRRALNRAWVRRWKNAKEGKFSPIAPIITPSWLRVESAIIFFRSHSIMATDPAINIVMAAIRRRMVLNFENVWRNG